MKSLLVICSIIALVMTLVTAYAPNEVRAVRLASILIAPLWLILAVLVAVFVD